MEVERIRRRVEEIDRILSKGEGDLQSLLRERGILEAELERLEKLEKLEREISELEEILKGDDEELKEMANEELSKLREKREKLISRVKEKSSCIVEIRAGVGGEEAALFAGDILRMYSKYAEKKGWTIKEVEIKRTDLGGVKEAVFIVEGDEAFETFSKEAGVHRVQRIPVTEASGRIHTSTATIAVLEEPDEVEVKIDTKDLKIETSRASGPGGQYVNMTDTAVRITHIPTGIVVTCQDERSQYMNKMKALRVLRARLLNLAKKEQEEKIAKSRKKQIGTASRSEKARTYNFMQNRVTDHRLGVTIYRLKDIMDGNLELIHEKG